MESPLPETQDHTGKCWLQCIVVFPAFLKGNWSRLYLGVCLCVRVALQDISYHCGVAFFYWPIEGGLAVLCREKMIQYTAVKPITTMWCGGCFYMILYTQCHFMKIFAPLLGWDTASKELQQQNHTSGGSVKIRQLHMAITLRINITWFFFNSLVSISLYLL